MYDKIRMAFPISLLMVICCAHLSRGQTAFPCGNFPGDSVILFAPDFLDEGFNNRDFAVSPDGNEIFITIQQPRFLTSTIIQIVRTDGKWNTPVVASFSGSFRDLEASFSFDGNTIFFSSDRPANDGVRKKDFDIWKVRKVKDGSWGEPEHLGDIVNSAANEFYPSVARNGNLYFTLEASFGKGKEDIVMCKFEAGKYKPPVSLSEAINSPKYEFNAFVDPEETFILFTSNGRADELGGGDLYVSKKDAAGRWLPAKHLPAPVNSSGLDYCPYVTRDRKYLIFTSNRTSEKMKDGKRKSYRELINLLKGPGNGSNDIYWVKFNDDW